MFYVTSLDGSQVEPLINIGSDFKMEQSVDGTFIVSFSCFPSTNNPGYDLLRSESIITVEGNDFKVKQYSDTAFSKTVTAVSTFYELGKTQRDGIFEGNHTLNNHLAFVLNGTGWTYTADSNISNVTNFINKFGDGNVIALIEKICKTHLIEYEILPNKTVHFAKQIGGDYDYQYRYKHNVSDVVLIEDTTNLHTFIRGYGADELSVSYSSPNIATFGKLEAEPIRDDRFKDAAALTRYIANSIVDVPELAIESRIPELTSRETGERIWLIYEPLNVEMQTRILKQTKVLRNGELITDSVVFGNTLIKSSIDILVEQQEQINDNKDYINETNDNLGEAKQEYTSRFEQTDSRITLEVEQLETSIAAVDVKADNINLSVNNRITNEVAAIDIRADQIESTISSQTTTISGLGSRISSAESSISQQASQIALKVSQTDYNGDTIATIINQTATTVSIHASKIDLVGAVTVLSDISGNLGTITAGTINSVNINSAYINISEDIKVGNKIELGSASSYATKTIQFNSYNRITGDGYSLKLAGIRIDLSAANINMEGAVDFSNATVSNLTADKVGPFHFAYEATGKLAVYRYGSKLGDLTLS